GNITQAYVKSGSDLDATGDIDVQAADSSSVIAISGGGAGAGTVAVGAAVGVVQIDNQIRAVVEDSSITSSAGAIAVTAGFAPDGNGQTGNQGVLSRFGLTQGDGEGELPGEVDLSAQIINVTFGGAGAGTFAAGASIALNWLKNTVEASVTDGST